MNNILIIGGAGYIGSHQVKLLLDEGYNVIVLDNLSTGFIEAVDTRATFIKGDIKDSKLLLDTFSKYKIDSVIHFAASSLVGESVELPLKYFDNNVYGMQVLLEAMVEANIKYLIFSSSAAVYGEQKISPITEDFLTKPSSPYGESKLIMENMIKWVSSAHDLKFIALRYFNVAGAHYDIGEAHDPETHLIPVVLQQPLGKREVVSIFGDDYNTPDGTCIRDYIHIRDLTQAHLDSLIYLKETDTSDIFNLGYGHGYSVKEIIDTASKVVGKEINSEIVARRGGDPDSLVADNTKIKSKIGWQPKYDNLENIISSAYNWHSNNPNGYKK